MRTASLLVKICGITREADGRLALDAGAALLGFILAKSPRRVSARRAAELVRRLRRHRRGRFAAMVGVFTDAPLGAMLRAARLARFDAVQLHGEEPPEYVAAVAAAGFRVVKTIKRLGRGAVQVMRRYPSAWAFLLEPRRAGPGRKKPKNPDFRPARLAVRAHPRVGVAGGVSAANVRKVRRDAGPGLWLLDAASSVERSPGVKDPKLVREFLRAAR